MYRCDIFAGIIDLLLQLNKALFLSSNSSHFPKAFFNKINSDSVLVFCHVA